MAKANSNPAIGGARRDGIPQPNRLSLRLKSGRTVRVDEPQTDGSVCVTPGGQVFVRKNGHWHCEVLGKRRGLPRVVEFVLVAEAVPAEEL